MTGTNASATTKRRRTTAGSFEDAAASTETEPTALSARGTAQTGGVAAEPAPEREVQPEPERSTPPAPAVEPEEVPVHVAIARVMGEVRAVEKNDRNNTPGASFNFRGIDAVTNALGPAMRVHGVIVLPEVIEGPHYRDVSTSQGKPSREVTLTARYTFVGPRGDTLAVIAPGEAMDTGDKGTAKAMSVALRIALLQTFILPTTERDPDADSPERGRPDAQQDIPGDPPPPGLHPADADALARSLVETLTAAGTKEEGGAAWNRVIGGPVRRHDVGPMLSQEVREVLAMPETGECSLEQYARAVGAYVGKWGQSVASVLSGPGEGK